MTTPGSENGPTAQCRLLSLPDELLEQIALDLDVSDTNSFCRASRYLYNFLFLTLCDKFHEVKGETCMDWAVRMSRPETVNRIIETKAASCTFPHLLEAAVQQCMDIVQMLIRQSSVLEEWKTSRWILLERWYRNERRTPLNVAVTSGNLDMVKLLLTQKHVVDAALTSRDGRTDADPVLCQLVRWGNKDARIAKLLLDHGAHIDAVSSLGDTAFMDAVSSGAVELFNMFLDYGADPRDHLVDAYGRSVLNHAAYSSLEITKTLLDRGVPVNHGNKPEETALARAISGRDNVEMVRLLLRAGIDPHKCRRPNHEHALHAAAARTSPSIEIMQMLLDTGVNVNIEQLDGATPLYEAVRSQAPLETIKFLLDAGAHVHARRLGTSMFEQFIVIRRFSMPPSLTLDPWPTLDRQILQLLLDNGLDISGRDDDGKTVLHRLASHYMYMYYIPEILKIGVDLEARDNDGCTPIFYSSVHNMSPLLRAGADIHVRNNRGQTPYEFARERGDARRMKMLLRQASKQSRAEKKLAKAEIRAVLKQRSVSDTNVHATVSPSPEVDVIAIDGLPLWF